MRITRYGAGIGWCLLISLATPAVAQHPFLANQAQSSRSSAEPVQPKNILDSVIGISFSNVPLEQGLQVVAKAANVRLTYLVDSSVRQPRVTLHNKRISVQASLQQLLRNTGLRAVLVAPNEIVITKSGKKDDPNQKVVQDSGMIHGRVIDSATNRPLVNAVVMIEGRNNGITNEEGAFVIRQLPAGQYVITVRRLGYTSGRRTVTLTEDQNLSLVIPLVATPSTLAEVVTTGAGERTKVEVGNSIATVNVDSLMQVTPVSTVSELLKNRIMGVQSISGTGAVGAPTRLRIRGISSVESDNAPIVIVDGIRITTKSTTDVSNAFFQGVTGGFGYNQPANDLSSRLDDIDPNTIASIEIMKGPAASTLYGSDAANGVIIIKTKRGQVGPARWNVFADNSAIVQPKDYDYPIVALGFPLRGNAGLRIPCGLANLYNGTCVPVPGQTLGFNMLEDPRFTPQATGHNRNIGVNVAGGAQNIQFYLGGTYLDQLGTSKLPEVNVNWIENGRDGQKLSKKILRPNARTNTTGTGRLTGSLGATSDYAVGATFASQYQRVGNDGMSSLLGNGSDVPRPVTDTTPLQGFKGWNATRTQRVKHTSANAQINWRPGWLGRDLFTFNGVYGLDMAATNDTYINPRGSCNPLCESASDQGVLGYVNTGRQTDYTQTVNLGGVLTVPLTSWLQSQTRVGGNYVRNELDNLYGLNTNLIPGMGIYGSGGTPRVNQIGDFRGTIGGYLEQSLNMRRTLFLTMGFRKDAGSSLGNTVTPVYPKWNGSWVLSQEPFFPASWSAIAPMVRLRAAYGSAGVMPSAMARIITYDLTTGFTADDGTSTGSFATIGYPGNLIVRPERSSETEGGFDIELFDSRFTFGFTAYGKKTKDAIISTNPAPSLGVGVSTSSTLMLNVGDVKNGGTEFETSLRILDRGSVSYTINANMTTSNNKLVSIAPGSEAVTSFSCGSNCGGSSSVLAIGYPLFGRWAYPIAGWNDIDGNGFISNREVKVEDSLRFVGPSTPTRTMYVGHTVGVLQNRVTMRMNLAYSGGMAQVNEARKTSASRYAVVAGPGAFSLRDQACLAVASITYTGERASDWCFTERIKVWRLQDLSFNFVAPASVAKMVRASSASLTLSGTNLHLWTNFHGIDPNVNTKPVNGNQNVAGTAFPTPRTYGFRVHLTY